MLKSQQLPSWHLLLDTQSLHPVPLLLQYQQPSLLSILGKEKPAETFKKKSMLYQNPSSWPTYITRTDFKHQQHQWSKSETLWKIVSGASSASQTRPECNPYNTNYHKQRSGTRPSEWKYKRKWIFQKKTKIKPFWIIPSTFHSLK